MRKMSTLTMLLEKFDLFLSRNNRQIKLHQLQSQNKETLNEMKGLKTKFQTCSKEVKE